MRTVSALEMSDHRTTAIAVASQLRGLIKAQRPGFWFRSKDAVGHKVNVHYDDGQYVMTLNYETHPWVTEEIIEAVNDDLDYRLELEWLSSYEVGLVVAR